MWIRSQPCKDLEKTFQGEGPGVSKLKSHEAQAGLLCSKDTECSLHGWSLKRDGECAQGQYEREVA